MSLLLYKLTTRFPIEERYRLADPMLRAAASIPTNIAEGFTRRRPRDQARFHEIARSSGAELKVHWMMAKDLGYCKDAAASQSLLDEVCAMLYVLRERVLSADPKG